MPLLSWNYPTKVKCMIVRLIVFIAIFFIGWWLYRQFVNAKTNNAPSTQKKSSGKAKKDDQENMVRCTQCQAFTPISHAVHDQDAKPFCCAEHLKDYHKQ